LYPDIFKKGAERDFRITPSDVNDGIQIKQLKLDGEEIDLDPSKRNFRRTSTNMILYLEDNIQPQTKTNIEIEWEFTLPRYSNIRMGRYTDDDIFVAYWFPQVAVYDDVDGWDKLEYSGRTEFYNNFGDYEVEITAPGNFLVWATGTLQNAEEVLQPNILNRLELTKDTDDVVNIVKEEDFENAGITIPNEKNIWKFKAEHVPDFSFAMSTDYLWDAVGVKVDKISGKRITAHAVYPIENRTFDKVAGYSKRAIEYMSFELPGVPFPYPSMTTFCNQRSGGGMETPMMANNGDPSDSASAFSLTFHEIAHTYFPFYMGTNERKYSWMDEGWATFLPESKSEEVYEKVEYTTSKLSYAASIFGSENDLPIMTPSYNVSSASSYAAWYSKPYFATKMLKSLLGEELFRKATQTYIERWKGKHPLPYDFFFTYETVAEQDLSWFWNAWYFGNDYVDLAVKNVSQYPDKVVVEIENKGKMPVTINLQLGLQDGTLIPASRNIDIWKDGSSTVKIEFKTNGKFKFVNLLNSQIPDINPENDNFTVGAM
jgi:hypothetical protein